MTPDAILLFAAGFGTRMGDLSKTRPKPLIKVAGKALIDHALDLCDHIPRRVANTHYLAEQMQAHLDPKGVAISHETPDVLETGGGLKQALPLLDANPVFTLNTDAVWQGPNPLNTLADAWDDTKMDALLIGIPPDQAIGHKGAGDFITDAQGRASKGPGLIYGGAQIIRTDLLAGIDQDAFSMWELWRPMLDAGRMYIAPYAGQWCDVGHPAGITLAEDMLRSAHV